MTGNPKKRKKHKNTKIIKYKRKPTAALLIFAAILIYVICFISLYLSKSKVQIYEVDMGMLTSNASFTAVCVRQEEVYNSSYSGNINYYKKDGTKVKVGDTIYTVDETGRVAEILAQYTQAGENSLPKDSLASIKSLLNSFRTNYDGSNFNTIYDLKAEINSEMLYAMNANIMNNLESIIENTGSNDLFKTVVTEKTGIVAYYVDGYEDVNQDNITINHFDKTQYNKNNLKSEELIVNEAPAYKLITSENWYMLINLTKKDIENYGLEGRSSVKVKFKKDGISASCNFSIISKDGQTYGKIDLDKYVIRYVNDRFLEIELASSTKTGLKIPISALTDCEFFTVPSEFLTKGGNSNDYGFICETYDTSGNIKTQFVNTTVYKTVDDMCYISTDAVLAGTNIVMPDSSKRYTVSSTAKLKGVYCVNTGYTDFKLVEVIDENSEYIISKKGISNGISLYDRIILDAEKYTLNQMVY